MNNNGSKPNGSKSSQDPKGNQSSKEKPFSADVPSDSNANKSGEAGRDANSSSQKEKYKKKYDEFEHRVKDSFKNLQDSNLYHYAASNKVQAITYGLLVLGLFLLIFVSGIIGSLIIGALAGYHFASQIIYYVRHLSQIFEGPDQFRYIVLTGTLVGLLVTTPVMMIAMAVAAALKQIFCGDTASK